MEEEIICNRWKDLADECRLEPNARSFLQPVGWAVTRISSPGAVTTAWDFQEIPQLMGFRATALWVLKTHPMGTRPHGKAQ